MNQTIQLIKQHKSIRRFTDQPIEEQLLNLIIECGQSASTSSFIQSYSIVQVTDSNSRNTLSVAAGNQSSVIDAAEFLVLCADMQRIQYCCTKANMGDLEGYTEHFIQATIDTALLAQNMVLAAESSGLGAVYIGGIRNDPETVSKCLNLPHHVYPAFGLCLGWPDQDIATKPRMPLTNILHKDTYSINSLSETVDNYDLMMSSYYQERSTNTKDTNWSTQTAQAIQGKKREHMLGFLQQRGFLNK